MKKSPPSTSGRDESVEALAAAWLAQRDDGLTAGEAADFARWQAADPRHAAAVARLEATWGALRRLREFRPEARVHPDRDLLARPGPSGRRLLFPVLAATAAIAAALVLAAVWWWPASYATGAGGYQRVTLEDGSVVDLNANSKIVVRFTAPERHVKLVRGEGYFTVAKNPARPFVVEAGAVSVRAVGTAFNVRRAASDVEVMVTEGKVKVEQHAAAESVAEPPLLLAGEKAVVTTAPAATTAEPVALQVQAIAPEAMREALAWQSPPLRFVDTPLAQVVMEFNRRNRVQLELADPGLAALPVDGNFRAENVESFVRLLTSGGDIVSERPEAKRIVLRKAH